jgi:hypothetical protein
MRSSSASVERLVILSSRSTSEAGLKAPLSAALIPARRWRRHRNDAPGDPGAYCVLGGCQRRRRYRKRLQAVSFRNIVIGAALIPDRAIITRGTRLVGQTSPIYTLGPPRATGSASVRSGKSPLPRPTIPSLFCAFHGARSLYSVKQLCRRCNMVGFVGTHTGSPNAMNKVSDSGSRLPPRRNEPSPRSVTSFRAPKADKRFRGYEGRACR